eukprot:1460302-Alexandrium_andersonii.AAC.1
MSASLVGSEMCIRDSGCTSCAAPITDRPSSRRRPARQLGARGVGARCRTHRPRASGKGRRGAREAAPTSRRGEARSAGCRL